ncbi:MAG TPA: invasin domain 3-containing protein, partial [Longimicrobiales bacterium]|nr:invasin domain 3-containing protein [Longimicrobiales bacterium]
MRTDRLRQASCVALMAAAISCSDGTGTGPQAMLLEVLAGHNANGVAGKVLPTPVTVRVVDRSGAGMSGIDVEFVVVEGGGVIAPAATRTGTDGTATAEWTLGTGAGLQLARASVPGGPTSSIVATAAPDVPAALVLAPDTLRFLAVGDTARLIAAVSDQYANPIPNAAVTWTATDVAVATVAGGLVQAAGQGGTNVTAAAGSVTAEAWVSVVQAPASVHVTPGTAALDAIGATLELAATVRDANGNPVSGVPVAWSTQDDEIVAVSDAGGVTARANGLARVIGAVGELADTAVVTVAQVPASLTVEPPAVNLAALLEERQLVATVRDRLGIVIEGVARSWTSSDTGVATVSPTGLVAAIGGGTATITVEAGGLSASVQVGVAQAPASLVVGTPQLAFATIGRTLQASVTVLDANGVVIASPVLEWATANASVATVSTAGVVTAVGPGSAAVIVTSGSASGTIGVTVTPVAAQVLVTPAFLNFASLDDTRPLTAVVSDSGGTVMPSAEVVWASSSMAVATVDGAGLVTATGNGTATITATSGAASGSAAVTVGQSPVGLGVVAGDGGSLEVGTPRSLTVKVTDAGGNAIAGVEVAWMVVAGGGNLSAPVTTTAADGLATVQWTAGTSAGMQSIHATVAGIAEPAVFAALAVPGPASTATSLLTVADATLPADGVAETQVAVRLRDEYGNDVLSGGHAVTIATTAGTLTSGAGAGGSVTADDLGDGSYTATLTSATLAGSATLTATLGGSPISASATVAFATGAATQYLVTTNTASVVAGGPVTITAQLADANGNPVTLAGRTVAWSKTGDGGSFASPNTATNASGIATVTFTTGTTAGTVYTFTGTDNLGAAGTSGPVTTTAGAATHYLVTTTPESAVVAGGQVAIMAQLADANGNAVALAGRTVTWSKTGDGGSFASPATSTNASGIATVTFTTATAADVTYTFTGTDNLGIAGTSGPVTTTAGAATQYLVTTTPESTVVAGGQVAITAQLADANGNAVALAG